MLRRIPCRHSPSPCMAAKIQPAYPRSSCVSPSAAQQGMQAKEELHVSRRKCLNDIVYTASLSLILLLQSTSQSAQAAEDSERRGIGRYIKKKKLEPLDTYVPAVVAAKNQLKRAGGMMSEKTEFAEDDLQGARELLRNGAFDGLRDNIRAIGEYAEQSGKKDAKKLSDGFFLAVQGFDFTLFQAKRNNVAVGSESDQALEKALSAFDSLLATVPADILDNSERIVKAVEESFQAQPATPKEESDKQMDQLMQLVPN